MNKLHLKRYRERSDYDRRIMRRTLTVSGIVLLIMLVALTMLVRREWWHVDPVSPVKHTTPPAPRGPD